MFLKSLSDLSVRNRIWAIVALLVSGIVLAGALNVLTLRTELWEEKEQKIRQLVDTGFSVLNHLHARQERGELSEAEAQLIAINTIKAMRYNEKEYFWLHDHGKPYPKVIMHPTISSLEGQLLVGEQFKCVTGLRSGNTGPYVATDGQMSLAQAFAEISESVAGAGYIAYSWPKPGKGAAATEERYPKLSYVRNFQPWGWVIGTGVYIDDVDAAMRTQIARNLLLVAGIGLPLLLFASLLARSITSPLRLTIQTMRAIKNAQDGLSHHLPISGHSEIAELARVFNEMFERLTVRDRELARHREKLEEEVLRRTAELQESEQKFSSICVTAQDAIIMLNQQCNISYWNPAAEKIFGYRGDEALGRNLHNLLAPERFRAAFALAFERFRQTGKGNAIGKTVEVLGLRKDGTEFPMELSISAICLHDCWSAVGFVRDISERKAAEQAIRENQRQMRALIDATTESVLLLSPQGTILAINTLAAQRFGQRPEEMTGKNFLQLLPAELASTRQAGLDNCYMTGEPTQTEDKRGAIFFENSLYPVKNESGEVESIAVYAKDATEHHRTKLLENIFRQLDTALLRWQMDLESIAQIFCDDVLPAFDLKAAWIGRFEHDGRLTLIAGADQSNGRLMDQLRNNQQHADHHPERLLDASHLPELNMACSKQKEWQSLRNLSCPSCRTLAITQGFQSAIVMPLLVRGDTWGALVFYANEVSHLNGLQTSAVLDTVASRLGSSFEAALQQEWLSLLETALARVENSVFITDANRKIIWVNNAFIQLSSYTKEEMIGQTPTLFSADEQSDPSYRKFWQMRGEDKPWQGQLLNSRRNGELYTVTQSLIPLLNGSGNISHYIAILEG